MHLAYKELDHGITCIEAHYRRPQLASCYMIEDEGDIAFIDTGTAHTMPFVLELLKEKGLSPDAVKYVMPTHVHLDHAGAAGHMMAAFPNATLIIHPFGARHMISPEKLIAGTIGVYGEEVFKRDYVDLIPIEESRVIAVEDGYQLTLGSRTITCLDTPGHARHHLCYWDEKSRGFFTGDTFGIAYPEFKTDKGDFPFLPSTPVQFDPEAWHQTLDRLIDYNPERMYLTHYCSIEVTEGFTKALHQAIDDYVAIAKSADTANRYDSIFSALTSYYRTKAESHRCQLPESEMNELLDMDLGLCAQGLDIWLQRQEKNG